MLREVASDNQTEPLLFYKPINLALWHRLDPNGCWSLFRDGNRRFHVDRVYEALVLIDPRFGELKTEARV